MDASDSVIHAPMFEATTDGITVTVTPFYLEEQSEPEADQYIWAYNVRIENRSGRKVQLVSRHWEITDSLGRLEEIEGPGVVGEQPVLRPGDSFEYTSGCPLTTPSGFMSGSYHMVEDGGDAFDVAIPAFSLDLPDAIYVTH